MARDDLWSDDELKAAMGTYQQAFRLGLAGVKFSPTMLHRELIATGLSGRNEGSVGRRMSNLSAVYLAEGLPVSPRYKPSLGHVGSGVTKRILRLYQEMHDVTLSPTADPGLLYVRTRTALASHSTVPPAGEVKPKSVVASTIVYERDPQVRAFVLQRGGGRCEACETLAPFRKADGSGFLEVHHLIQLAAGGADTTWNAIAACPNCHRRLHHGEDRAEYREAIWRRRPDLRAPQDTQLDD
ncbi:MAG: 5-methylcytosine-specific restriction enzyme [Caulobacter sp.]|nr:5-methylcytosine-specific restriction enzyme [Caulobacter sp.]